MTGGGFGTSCLGVGGFGSRWEGVGNLQMYNQSNPISCLYVRMVGLLLMVPKSDTWYVHSIRNPNPCTRTENQTKPESTFVKCTTSEEATKWSSMLWEHGSFHKQGPAICFFCLGGACLSFCCLGGERIFCLLFYTWEFTYLSVCLARL